MWISKECERNVRSEISKYIRQIQLTDISCLSFDDSCAMLYVCSELLDVDTSWEENRILKYELERLLKKICAEIYTAKERLFQYTGIMSALGLLAYSMEVLENKNQKMSGFIRYCNREICEGVKRILCIMKNKPTEFAYYDIPCGLSGSLNYMLDHAGEEIEEKVIMDSLDYVLELTEFHQYQEKRVIGFHIEKEQQYLESERKSMPQGNINFGLAHGMVGVGIALAKAYFYGYKKEECAKAVNIIMKEYTRYGMKRNGQLIFPTQLPIELYLNKQCKEWSFNAGWCYGNAGILMGLMRMAGFLGMSEKYGYYEKTLLKVINQPIKRYNFQLPILCHGYASIIAIQIGMYKECENEEFLQTLERNVKRAINIQNIYKDKNREYESDFSILQGTGGVMVTLADTLNLSMNYRKMLMIS